MSVSPGRVAEGSRGGSTAEGQGGWEDGPGAACSLRHPEDPSWVQGPRGSQTSVNTTEKLGRASPEGGTGGTGWGDTETRETQSADWLWPGCGGPGAPLCHRTPQPERHAVS